MPPRPSAWCWLLPALALPLTAQAYSVRETDTGAIVHWGDETLTIAVDRSTRRAAAVDDVRGALAAAVAAWNEAGSGPSFVVGTDLRDEDPTPADGILGVYAPSRWPTDPDYLAVTVSTYESSTGRLVDADVLLNDRKPFERFEVEGSPDEDQEVHGPHAYDLDSVLAHELGHVLGLGESEDAPDATMWPRLAKRTVHARTPADDDRAGIAAIYGGRGLAAPGGCAVGPGATTPLGVFLLVALLIAARRRTRLGRAALPLALVIVGALASPALGSTPDPSAPRLVLRGARAEGGVVLTRFATVDSSGRAVEIEVAGGRFDGLVQRVGDVEPPLPGAIATFRAEAAGKGWLVLADGSRMRAFAAR